MKNFNKDWDIIVGVLNKLIKPDLVIKYDDDLQGIAPHWLIWIKVRNDNEEEDTDGIAPKRSVVCLICEHIFSGDSSSRILRQHGIDHLKERNLLAFI